MQTIQKPYFIDHEEKVIYLTPDYEGLVMPLEDVWHWCQIVMILAVGAFAVFMVQFA